MAENQNIEWKEFWKDEYFAWICGYANAQGGKLYVGMNDSGQIVGISNSHKLLEDLPNKIRDAMGIIVDINLLESNGKEYIEINVPSYPIAISCKGSYYYRSGSTNQKLTGPELESFILRRRGVTWDSMPLPTFTSDDIDDSVVKKFKKLALKKGRIDASVLDESKEVLMEKLLLTHAGYYTNAAMLLFSSDPEKWQLGAFVKIGYFENDTDLIYQDEIHGSLLEQIDKIVEVIHLKYMKAKISYNGMQRIEKYFVPEDALREALLNALCHKNYSNGIPAQISVYEDKLYIANCGALPENWTLENLMSKHASKPFNPNIAHTFYLAGFIESWGRGIEKICNACRDDGVNPPEYTIHPGDIMIKFSAPESRIVRSISSKVTDRVTDRVTDKEQLLLDLLTEDPAYTYTALSEKLGVSRKTVSARIKNLKEKGIISRVGSDIKGTGKLTEISEVIYNVITGGKMFRIGEFSKLTQVTIRMLRYYDEMGLLKPAEIDPWTSYRMYSVEQIPILNKIIYLRDSGFNVAEIAKALDSKDDNFVIELLNQKYKEIEQTIQAEKEKLRKIEFAKKELLSTRNEMHYNVSIKSIPAYQVLSLRRIIPTYYAEGELWEELSSFAAQNQVTISNNTFSIYHDAGYKEQDVDVELCAVVKNIGENIGEFTYRITQPIPAMACTMVYGEFSNIAGAYLAFAEWLQRNSRYRMNGATRQIVHRGPWNENDPKKYLTEIQIPLEKE